MNHKPPRLVRQTVSVAQRGKTDRTVFFFFIVVICVGIKPQRHD